MDKQFLELLLERESEIEEIYALKHSEHYKVIERLLNQRRERTVTELQHAHRKGERMDYKFAQLELIDEVVRIFQNIEQSQKTLQIARDKKELNNA